jgi:hypothetical protein
MRPCKPSDVQALEAIVNGIEQLTIEATMLRGKLAKLRTDVNNYLKQQQEPINVPTTHGLSADSQ